MRSASIRATQTIDHRVVPRPDSRYGVSKAFGEALASLYSDKHGIGVLCTRIGNFGTKPIDKRRLSIWISPRDYTQLVRIGLEHPDIRYEIVYGVSNNRRSWYDNSNAERLGYRPQDDSEPYAEAVLAAEAGRPPTRSLSTTRAARSAPPNTRRKRRGRERGYSTDSTASGGRPSAALLPETTIGRSTMIGFLTIAAISCSSDKLLRDRCRRPPPPSCAPACSPASSAGREAASAGPPYRASSNIRRSSARRPFSRSNAKVLREVLQRGLW